MGLRLCKLPVPEKILSVSHETLMLCSLLTSSQNSFSQHHGSSKAAKPCAGPSPWALPGGKWPREVPPPCLRLAILEQGCQSPPSLQPSSTTALQKVLLLLPQLSYTDLAQVLLSGCWALPNVGQLVMLLGSCWGSFSPTLFHCSATAAPSSSSDVHRCSPVVLNLVPKRSRQSLSRTQRLPSKPWSVACVSCSFLCQWCTGNLYKAQPLLSRIYLSFTVDKV